MADVWNQLGEKYETSQVRDDSLDSLVEWPAQLQAVGDVTRKRILDVGCGSGRKAFHFASVGAQSVVGIDLSSAFIEAWNGRSKPANLEFHVGDRARLAEIPALQGRAFDLVVCFQALGLLYNPGIFCAMRKLQPSGGRLVFTGAHSFRYVAMRMETESIPPGVAYRDESPFSYPSPWDPSVNNTDAKPMISTVINLLLGSGYRLERMTEPDLTEEQRRQFPQKAAWMDRYFGIMVFEATAV